MNKNKQKKRVKKTRSRRSRTTRALAPVTQVSVAGVVSTSAPRPFLKMVSAHGDKVVVRGQEMLTTVFASQNTRNQGPFLVNPAFANVFPRLSPLALSFEKWRPRRLAVHYHSAAPTTRSGQVAVAMASDPESLAPSDVIEVYNFDHSLVTPVGMGACTPMMNFPDNKWYLTSVISNSGFAVDPTNRFAAKLFIMSTRAAAADNGLIAGEVSIEYEIEFCNARPALNVSTMNGTVDDQTFGDTAARLTWSEIISQIGWWGLEPDNDDPIATGSSINMNQSWLVDTGEWIIDYLLDFAGVTFEDEEKTPNDHRLQRSRSTPGYRKVTYIAEKQLRGKNRGGYVSRRLSASVRPLEELTGPLVAGDVTISLKLRASADASNTTLATTVFSQGTGILSADAAIPFVITEPGRLYLEATLATGETRTIDAGNAYASLQVVAETPSLFG